MAEKLDSGRLTPDECQLLAKLLKKMEQPEKVDPAEYQKNMEESFERHWALFVGDCRYWENMSIKDIASHFYTRAWEFCGGTAGEEIPPEYCGSIESMFKYIDDMKFIDEIQRMLRGEKVEVPEGFKVESGDGYVEIIQECTANDKAHCVAWPDRCEEVGGNGEHCTYKVKLERIVGEHPQVS